MVYTEPQFIVGGVGRPTTFPTQKFFFDFSIYKMYNFKYYETI